MVLLRGTYGLRRETFHLPNRGDTHISPGRSLAKRCGVRHRLRVVIWGAEHSATVVGFLRAHRGRSAPPGSTVPGCQTVRVFIVQLLHTRIPASLLHPFSGRRYLYAAKTPASQIRPTGLCLLSISAEELLVSVVRWPLVVYEFRALWKLST